jgi:hypothetical protein
MRKAKAKATFAVICFGLAATTAQAQPATTLTLACKGTKTNIIDKDYPVSMGLIINLADRTIQGFLDPNNKDLPVKITWHSDHIQG